MISITTLGSIIALVYGTIVGSFLNVCIYRWPEEKSVVSPPSHCPNCNTRLKPFDLVPLLSFLMLGRKCRYCGVGISWRYFTVELLTGIVFVLTFLRFGYTIDTLAYILFLSFLIVAFVVDLEHFIIPDQVSIIAVAIGLARDIANLIAGNTEIIQIHVPFTELSFPMLPSILGIVLCGGAFYLLAYVSFYAFMPRDEEARKNYEGAMGGGDVKLAAAIGAVLGIVPGFVSFLIAVMVGTVVGIIILVKKSRAEKRGVAWRTEVPFGPYMVIGAVCALFFWPQLETLWQYWIRLVVPV